jgi:hypothetical protein
VDKLMQLRVTVSTPNLLLNNHIPLSTKSTDPRTLKVTTVIRILYFLMRASKGKVVPVLN